MFTFLVCQHLSSKTVVLKGAYTETYLDAVVGHIKPAVRKVDLKLLWFVKESVPVHIMRSDVARNMSEDHRTPFVAHLKR